MAGEGLQKGGMVLRVTTKRDRGTERGQEVIQVLIDLLYLLLLCIFGFFFHFVS